MGAGVGWHCRGFVDRGDHYCRRHGCHVSHATAHWEQCLSLIVSEICRRSSWWHLRYLADAAWPIRDGRVEESQAMVRLARESLAAVDEVGWPDTG
jgi:hypothetical protein